jgi:glycosyltransferase involved in cell wall biosynthesis
MFAVGALALPILVLRPTRRFTKLYGARVSTLGRNLLEPITYLNDFDRAAAGELATLSPDVIHAHDLVTLSCGAHTAALLRSRLVYDAHELETHTNYHGLSRQTTRWIARYEAMLIRRCDAVLTVSDSIAVWLANEYEIPRPTVVMNAPERLSTTPPPRTLRESIGIEQDTPLVVYVGSVTVDRGLELCVEALEFLPGVHLATVGWRYEETERRMIEEAARLGVRDRLHLVDPVPSREVIGFIRDADASVMAIQNVCLSYYFCFPNKLLESIFAGLPVAVADLVELRRFVEENPVGLVMNERDPRSIASTLELLLDSNRFRPDPRQIEEIAERYGWEAQELRLLEVYRRLNRRRPSLSHATSQIETAQSGV